jgi:hypothetical protein
MKDFRDSKLSISDGYENMDLVSRGAGVTVSRCAERPRSFRVYKWRALDLITRMSDEPSKNKIECTSSLANCKGIWN